MLYGRVVEERRISTLLSEAARGRSGAVAVIAGPGEGKSALLERAAELVDDSWRILRCTGVETAVELPFSGLKQLLRPALHHSAALPEPQYRALCCALGLEETAEHPERFLVGLATLSLLAELSAEGPVLCLIDDAQWVDQPTVDALLFTARRLGAESVAVLFAGRPDFNAPGLPQLHPAPLDPDQARALLAERSPNLPVELRERVVAQSAGNPLALLELPGMNLDSMPVGPLALSDRLQSGYQEHITTLPAATRVALLVAAADETGELGLVLRVLDALGFGPDTLADAELTTMITVSGQSVTFRHPLLRAAAYRIAPDDQRRAVHAAIAEALVDDPDRRAWHLASAATGEDETVAAALESAAIRAYDRTGIGTAATAWQRAALLSPDPVDKVRRMVKAIENAGDAGQFARARSMAEFTRTLPTDPVQCARISTVLATIEFEHGSPAAAHRLMLNGAAEAARDDPALAAVILLSAGRVAWADGDLAAMRKARDMLAELAASPDRDRFLHAFDGFLKLYDEDPTEGITLLRAYTAAEPEFRNREADVRFVLVTTALETGDVDTAREVLAEMAELSRVQGRLRWLATTENWLGHVEFVAGRFREAELLSTEGRRIGQSIEAPLRVTHAEANLALVAAVTGDEQRTLKLATAGLARPDIAVLHRVQFDWALAVLDMACGRYAAALERLEELDKTPLHRQARWLLAYADRVEAAFRLNQPERAAAPLAALRVWADALEAPWARAFVLRGEALLEGDPEKFARALELHAAQGRWFDRARTGLLYGEWLRKQRNLADARIELRDALQTFERLGAHTWAALVRTELRAAGEGAVPEASSGLAALLTPQELQVVRAAAAGATNKEIGARLFLSPKTVGHHLSRAFRKLGVSSRVELARLELD
ncbi:LuxR C-terminal-related transcriptional regulator [Nocardia sp. NPDC051030]|uniref:helix-turn-helix transcriptional regulator n=1 Tax=Nocardia sp. NPDC051030 TaxID=3155162 RepID=UPI00342F7599